jgi:hypothetical protein
VHAQQHFYLGDISLKSETIFSREYLAIDSSHEIAQLPQNSGMVSLILG